MTKYVIVNVMRDPLVRYGTFDTRKDAEAIVKRIWDEEGYEVYVDEEKAVEKHVELWGRS